MGTASGSSRVMSMMWLDSGAGCISSHFPGHPCSLFMSGVCGEVQACRSRAATVKFIELQH